MGHQLANEVWRDFVSAGIPSSGENEPDKVEIRKWGTFVESLYSAAQAGGGLAYETKADMNADLAHGANQIAWVMEDPTAANNGVYAKVGASGSGSWTRLGDLPYSYIKASNAGAGTANAIVATTSVPIPAADGGALVALPIVADNTASPVTVSFNGGAALTVKTNSGNDVSIGGLTAGMIPAGYVSGTTFRLLSDQAGAATAAAAEAAADRAEAAAASIDLPAIAGHGGEILGAKADASGTEYKSLTYIRGSHLLTPYDYGVSPLDPLDADVFTALANLFGDVKSDYYSTTGYFRSKIGLAHRQWVAGTSIDFTQLRQTGATISDGAIYGKMLNRPIIDLSGTQGVIFDNVNLWGDKDNQPSFGLLLMRARYPSGTGGFGGVGSHRFSNMRIDGFFQKSGILNYGSEVNQFVNCQIGNRSKIATRPALMISGHSDYNTKWLGTVDSDYIAAGDVLTGATSNINHDLGSLDIRRPSPWGALAMQSITKSSTCTITLVSAPVTGFFGSLPPVTGDRAFFHEVAGMSELNQQLYWIKKIDDVTYELYTDAALTTPLNSTGFGAFVSGFMWGATGEALVITGSGVADIHGSNGYILTYGADAVVFDNEYDNSGIDDVELSFQHEAQPIRSVRYVTPAAGNVNHSGHKIEILNRNQNHRDSFIASEPKGGTVTLRGFEFKVAASSVDPAFGWLSRKQDFALINADINLPRAGAFTGVTGFAASGFSGRVKTMDDNREYSYGPDKTWTPSMKFGGASAGMAYTAQVGWYERLGELIFAHFYINLSAKGTSTGAMTIEGLPATATSGTGRSGTVTIERYQNLALIAEPTGDVQAGTTSVRLYSGSAANSVQFTEANVTDSGLIAGVAVYRAADI